MSVVFDCVFINNIREFTVIYRVISASKFNLSYDFKKPLLAVFFYSQILTGSWRRLNHLLT